MNWEKTILQDMKWNGEITNKEQKQKLALELAKKANDGDVIGFGSGSTSFLTVLKIAEKIKEENIRIIAIPTSYEIKMLCNYLEIPTVTILEKKPDWSFDGVDEIDKNNWMIKGRGAAMFKEKLNILNSPTNYILIDQTKFVKELGEKHPVPVEVFPQALEYVSRKLEELGATETIFRGMTENQNAILDVRFEKIDNKLETKIKNITGVIESGLFMGYNVEIISL